MDSHPGKRQLGHRNAAHIQRHARTQRFSPQQDAAVLTPLLARGAIVMGKTNLEELSVGWSSNNGEFGAVLNPYAMQHSPGGSSGGSAVVVAARIAPVSVGEDTFGLTAVDSASRSSTSRFTLAVWRPM
jgi:mandelamide amidase